ncbi:MAG: hypothetical protein HZB23_11615 [Deltaproteobacteria bacterium]|nr:hypothetical protein [Deltaproteobacteria bacterium]
MSNFLEKAAAWFWGYLEKRVLHYVGWEEKKESPQRIPRVNRDDVLRVIRRDFPEGSEEQLMALFDPMEVRDWYGKARVQLAVLKAAGGDLAAIPEYMQLASWDYRDILTVAEYPSFRLRHDRKHKISPEELEKSYQDDWEQYQEWLNRK